MILGIVGFILFTTGCVWLVLRARRNSLTTVEVCVVCGTRRTTILDPQPRPDRHWPLLHGIKSRTYSYSADYSEQHPPATDGISICRGRGHYWGSNG